MPSLLTRLGFWLVNRGQRQDKSRRTVVTSQQRERILELDADGCSLREIAGDVGCSAETVRKILRLAKPRAEPSLKDRLEAIALRKLESDPDFQEQAVDRFMERMFPGRRGHSHLEDALEELRLLKDLEREASPSGSGFWHDLANSPVAAELTKTLPALLALGQPQASAVSVVPPAPASLPGPPSMTSPPSMSTPPPLAQGPSSPAPEAPPPLADAGIFELVLTRLLPLIDKPGKDAADLAWALLDEFDRAQAQDQADLLLALVHMPLARLQALAYVYKSHERLAPYVDRLLSDQGRQWLADFSARWGALEEAEPEG